jgi:hypothetical protein
MHRSFAIVSFVFVRNAFKFSFRPLLCLIITNFFPNVYSKIISRNRTMSKRRRRRHSCNTVERYSRCCYVLYQQNWTSSMFNCCSVRAFTDGNDLLHRSLGAIRLACSLIAHFEPPQQSRDEKVVKGKTMRVSIIFVHLRVSFIDIVSEYSSRAIDLICEKGTTDSQLFLAALDTLISFVTDPIFQLRE